MTLVIKTMLEPLGWEMIGDKFPQETRIERKRKRNNPQTGSEETPKQTKFRKYLLESRPQLNTMNAINQRDKENERAKSEKMKKMNPMGFYEGRYSVIGASWHIGIEKILHPKSIVKIVSQGLPKTDPKYCDKMVFMLRKPCKVASSQENLVRQGGLDKVLGENEKVHDVTMFIKVTTVAARWFHATGVKPLIVEYDDFTMNPDKGLDILCKYLGLGDPKLGLPIITEKLSRSKDLGIDPDGSFAEADEIYKLMLKSDFKGVMDFKATNSARANAAFRCFRTKAQTNYNHCKSCHSDKEFMRTLRDHCDKENIDWRKEVCSFECGYDPDRYHDDSYISVEDSIKNNHWIETDA